MHRARATIVLAASLAASLVVVAGAGAGAGCFIVRGDTSGRACDADHACDDGFVCLASACELACKSNDDCPDGRSCDAGGCSRVVVVGEGEGGEGEGEGAEGEGELAEGEGEGAGPNTPPVATDVDATLNEDVAHAITLDADDADVGDALTFAIVDEPVHGTIDVVGAVATYTPQPGYAGPDAFTFLASDGVDDSNTAHVNVAVVGRACNDYHALGGDLVDDVPVDGLYTIDPDGDGAGAAYDAFCLMTVEGGGWTLALKADGTKPTFTFDAAAWTDDTLLPDPTGGDVVPRVDTADEAKLRPYLDLPVDEVLVEMFTPPDPAAASRTLRVPLEHIDPAVRTSLRDLIAGPTQSTRLGTQSWRSLMPVTSLAQSCIVEGINSGAALTSDEPKLRIGLLGGTSCSDFPSRIGVGGTGSRCTSDVAAANANSVGTVAGQNCGGVDNSAREIRALAFVFVRKMDMAALGARSSCKTHYDGGARADGFYSVDPDGPTGAVPFTVFCDMNTDGGGWLLAGRSSLGGLNEPFGWSLSTGLARDDGVAFAVDVIGHGLTFSEVLIGDRSAMTIWGPNVYAYTLPPDFETTCATALCDVAPAVVRSTCALTDVTNIGSLGNLNDGTTFRMSASSTDGLKPGGFQTGFACAGGNVDNLQGMLMVR